jgi:hypothetical protein
MGLALLLTHSSSLRLSADVEGLSEAVRQSFEASRPVLDISNSSKSMNSLEPHQANSFGHFSDDAEVQNFESGLIFLRSVLSISKLFSVTVHQTNMLRTCFLFHFRDTEAQIVFPD